MQTNNSEIQDPKDLQTLDWLKVGQSFIVQSDIPKRKNVPNYMGEDLIEQSKKFFNVDKRKSAADYIDDQFSCDEISEKNLKITKTKKVFFLNLNGK